MTAINKTTLRLCAVLVCIMLLSMESRRESVVVVYDTRRPTAVLLESHSKIDARVREPISLARFARYYGVTTAGIRNCNPDVPLPENPNGMLDSGVVLRIFLE